VPRPALSRSTVDRAAHRRTDSEWLAAAWPGSRVLVVHEGRARVVDGDEPRLLLVSAADAPAGERFFLGEEEGSAYFAVSAPLPPGRAATLRDVGAQLGDRDAGLLTHAVALDNWHATHVRCSRCGTRTEIAAGGHVRRCPADDSEHYPRVDPAVIMLVHDGVDRVVLGRAPSWPAGRHSVLAGFVEPGESLEQAVAREVAEEVGLAVRDLRYVASQPWPFPSSLMLAFTARADYGELRVDPTELASAAWFTRAEVVAGVVGLPSAVSVARRLLDAWVSAA
jgi:NAD+ diphosphatase